MRRAYEVMAVHDTWDGVGERVVADAVRVGPSGDLVFTTDGHPTKIYSKDAWREVRVLPEMVEDGVIRG